MTAGLEILPVRGIPEVHPGDDLAGLLLTAVDESGLLVEDGDVWVIAQKVVSKAEGRLVALDSVVPSQFAVDYARQYDKDARHVEVVLNESRRIVRMDHGVLIVETHHGLVCANAGVDASNVEGADVLCLLPVDPDRSAAELVAVVRERTGSTIALVISDTFGRPWREGQTNIAIGVAGIDPLRNYAGQTDQYGYELRVTQLCVVDELAGAAELVMGKIDRVPAAIVRGFEYTPAAGSAQFLVRAAERDLFR
jgi:coenzyme F420-0:L-glutamate ligase / coenzyme F420-1:gamma-L-glutamate ligase